MRYLVVAFVVCINLLFWKTAPVTLAFVFPFIIPFLLATKKAPGNG